MPPAGRDKDSGGERKEGDLPERAPNLSRSAPAEHLHPEDLEPEGAPDQERSHPVETNALGDCFHVDGYSSSFGRLPPIATPASANST